MTMRSFIDTNVVVYLFDNAASAKQVRARQLLQEEVSFGRAILSTQVIQEFFVTVTRKLAKPLTYAAAASAVEHLCAMPIVTVNPDLIKTAIRRSESDVVSFWDALIIETALSCGATTLWTEDLQNGRQIDNLSIRNPFS